MVENQDITPEKPASVEPERAEAAAADPSARRRRALFAAAAILGVFCVVLAALSPMVGRLSGNWLAEPAAAAAPAVPMAAPAADGGEALARQRAVLAAERERLYLLTDQAVATAMAIEFGAMRLRAPVYASWAYGWVQSYVTSYQIIGRGIAGGFAHLTSGQPGSTLDAMAAEAIGVVREHFRAVVVQPERTQKALDTEWDRIATLLEQEFIAIERRQEATLAALHSQSPSAVTEMPKAARVPVQSRGNLVAETPDIDTILVRSARPWAARAGMLVLRLTEVGSVAAIVGSLGLSFGPFTGIVVGVVGGIGLSWAIDYVINGIDAALHRDELESHAVAFVDALQVETNRRLTTAFRTEIDAHISAIEAALIRAFP